MEILKELYYGNISECDRKISPTPKLPDKEYLTYERIKELLPNKDKQLIDLFIDLLCERYDQQLENTYIQGFKTGLNIAIECNNLKL